MADWDLYAVVRSCTSATNTNTTQNSYTILDRERNSADPLACLASLTFEEDDDPFSFPNLVYPSNNNGSGELQDSYKPFLPTPTITNSQGIIPSSSDSDFGGLIGTQQQQLEQIQPANTSISLPFNPTPPIFAFGESSNQQQPQLVQQQQQQQNQQRQQAGTSSALPLRAMQSQPSRPRKRKNQQKRMVCHVTADNLSSDLWSWRKYGQKPIKGSPYPRNYYRCSSSKGCSARKQVEKSNAEANIFVVTYTGDHIHPRPTHRNSLAGSTRNNKLSTVHEPASKDSVQQPSIANASCSSPLSTTSLSPTTSLPGAPTEEETMNDNGADDKESEEMIGEDDEDDDLLIPNLAMNEDLFLGLQELGSSSIGGAGIGTGSGSGAGSGAGLRKSPSFRDNFSSLGAGSSAAAGATAGGGC